MRSSRTSRLLAALTPLGVVLVCVGTAVLVAGTDAGIPAILIGVLVLVAGLAGVHGLLAPRYGGLGLAGFLATQLALVVIFLPVAGLGFLLLIPAAALLSWALVRMEPPLRGPALALIGVWPAAALVDALGSIAFAEALATMFALPYAWLAFEARNLPVPAPE